MSAAPGSPTSAGVEGGPDHPDLPVKPPLILLVSILAGYLVDRLWPAASRPEGWGVLGIALVVLAFVLMLAAMRQFAAGRTSAKPWKPTRLILDRGPFRFTRNPIYLGFVLLQAGIGIWQDRLAVLLFALPAAIVLDRVVIRREEAYLLRKFGAPYEEYRARVRRWI